ncbi:uncharacterized protein LOC144146344 [Haemaphysalis longicornis]
MATRQHSHSRKKKRPHQRADLEKAGKSPPPDPVLKPSSRPQKAPTSRVNGQQPPKAAELNSGGDKDQKVTAAPSGPIRDSPEGQAGRHAAASNLGGPNAEDSSSPPGPSPKSNSREQSPEVDKPPAAAGPSPVPGVPNRSSLKRPGMRKAKTVALHSRDEGAHPSHWAGSPGVGEKAAGTQKANPEVASSSLGRTPQNVNSSKSALPSGRKRNPSIVTFSQDMNTSRGSKVRITAFISCICLQSSNTKI